jgi:Tannase-like family of unknown function (DUF6351)
MQRCMAVLAALVLAFTLLDAAPAAADRSALTVEVVSNRADLVSGGDALVRVSGPARVEVDGRDVTPAFHTQPDGSLLGLVEGLADGENRLTARQRFGAPARITITNHPTGGPIFSGPQVQPWVCGTERAGLGPATDAQCNAPTRVTFVYRNAQTGQFAPYDPAAPPPAELIVSTTTDQGRTVPYVVRIERGTADRGIYDIAVLADPAGWNHKLVVPFGGGAAPHHTQDLPLQILDDSVLSRGFMIATSGLNVQGQNANGVVSAEAVLMFKERIVERYGQIRYTIGAGCSGGAIQQQLIAAAYPGLLDGIQPNCSYTDVWTTGTEVVDCHLLLNYFTNVAPALWPDPAQRALVDGHHDVTNCLAWNASFAPVNDPTRAANCNLPQALVYHPQTNPTGVRCTIADYMIAVWGPRPQDGFAKLPGGNLGVQYGLNALNAGAITPAQFVDLNAKIGSKNIDWQFQAQRAVPDFGALRTAYRAGQVTDARQLADVPIIDLRGYHETQEIHTSFHSYKMRAKLDRDNGGHANQIIWTFPPSPSIVPPPDIALRSFLLMDAWLAGIEADHSGKPRSAKVIAHKPAAAVDACWIDGTQVLDAARCAATYPPFADARIAAGSPLSDDVLQCRLRQPRRTDYRATFTDAEWAALLAAFPLGVCDWTRPGIAVRPSIPWMTYADGPGGRPLGAPPRA